MHDVSGGNLLLPFIRGFFEGVFVLSVADNTGVRVWELKSVAPAPSEMFLG